MERGLARARTQESGVGKLREKRDTVRDTKSEWRVVSRNTDYKARRVAILAEQTKTTYEQLQILLLIIGSVFKLDIIQWRV